MINSGNPNMQGCKKAATRTIGLAAFFVIVFICAIGCGTETKSLSQGMAGRAATSTTPAVETKTETKTEAVAFTSVYENDPASAVGQNKVKQQGVNGSKEVTYTVTYINGKETKRERVSEKVVTPSVPMIILVGAYVAPVTQNHGYGYYDDEYYYEEEQDPYYDDRYEQDSYDDRYEDEYNDEGYYDRDESDYYDDYEETDQPFPF